jgi:hypothetical protein
MSQFVFTSKNPSEARDIARRAERGELIKIRSGIYVDGRYEEIPELFHSKWYEVVNYLYGDKNPIAIYRTAHELTPIGGNVFIGADVNKRSKIHVSPELIINLFPATLIGTEGFILNLKRSGQARQWLENLSAFRERKGSPPKSLGQEWVENKIIDQMEKVGEEGVNRIRDEAKNIASKLDLNEEAKQLNMIISAILTTNQEDDVLISQHGKSRQQRKNYDRSRIESFAQLSKYLSNVNMDAAAYKYSKESWRNISFFESYFSNYIEGTEFEIDEAEDIVFERKIDLSRHEDSHDIIAVFDVVSDYNEMLITPDDSSDFINLIKERHERIMSQRPDKKPGEFKERNNKAGNTVFVHPDQVEDTLKEGFEIYRDVEPGMKRAIFMQFLVSECHPFNDGNGRLSRIMLNAEMTSQDLQKIIVPTVSRDNYLNALRKAKKERSFLLLTKFFYQHQKYAADINWDDYAESKDRLTENGAFMIPDDGTPRFNRELIKFR